jgi:hypothetical protein
MPDGAEQEGLVQAAQAGAGEDPSGAATRKESNYMVSRAVSAEFVKTGDEEGVQLVPSPTETGIWLDIGWVAVPQRSQRKTVVSAALELFEIDPDSHPSLFRVAAEGDAEPVPVVVKPPEPAESVVQVG